ncbi:MAG: hypothetical protein JSV84_18000 [Gemmatimonadota bacterium]|nr:MAG: hypothetical protein JSV84_18000 [Gemmatimonadota bacterium]
MTGPRKHLVPLNLPYAFTEHGALMAANVLGSERAAQMSVFVVRAFARLRHILASHVDLAKKLDELEKKYDVQFRVVFDAIRQLMKQPEPPKREIGFRSKEEIFFFFAGQRKRSKKKGQPNNHSPGPSAARFAVFSKLARRAQTRKKHPLCSRTVHGLTFQGASFQLFSF